MTENIINFNNIWEKIVDKCPPDTIIYTLSNNKPNKIVEIIDEGIMVETTDKPKLIQKNWIEKAHNFLINDKVLRRDDHEKSTHRSSFIFALFVHIGIASLKTLNPMIIENLREDNDINYFIFVFNDTLYEDESNLGKIYNFPTPDKGGFKIPGKSVGSWGKIIGKVKMRDKVIWTISGSSNSPDKKKVWGYGEIIGFDNKNRYWKIKSIECEEKVITDDIINKMPMEYRRLYIQSSGNINIGFYGTILIDKYQYELFIESCKGIKKEKISPRITVMNIHPDNMDYCREHVIHGTKNNPSSIGVANKLKRGDICIIRKTWKSRSKDFGPIGIWQYIDKEDIEGTEEPHWIPPDVWKFKLILKPLVLQFKETFLEDFSVPIEGKEKLRESSKVEGLTQSDIQGAVSINFKDNLLPNRYLKAIIDEKNQECNIQAEYISIKGSKHTVNVYEFLNKIADSGVVELDLGEVPELPTPSSSEKSPTVDIHEFVKEFLKHLKKKELIIPNDVIYRIFSAILANKNIILTGPPGCGKTTLAIEIGNFFKNKKINKGIIPTTATSDWSTFETIGGYFPKSGGDLTFNMGLFLEAIKKNKWLIIDEINRADIDKALGELHTVISGQSVLLPFREGSKRIKIIPYKAEDKDVKDIEAYNIKRYWRIIGTMNSYDKSFLFNLSYALMRRFAFIDVSVPNDNDYKNLIDNNLSKLAGLSQSKKDLMSRSMLEVVSKTRSFREIGPAIILDTIEYIESRRKIQITGDKNKYLKFLGEGLILCLFPQFEGLKDEDFNTIISLFNDVFSGETILQELKKKMEELKNL